MEPVAAAACEAGGGGSETAHANAALARTSGLPGRGRMHEMTESRYQPGATRRASVTFTRLPALARPVAHAGEASGSRTSRAR